MPDQLRLVSTCCVSRWATPVIWLYLRLGLPRYEQDLAPHNSRHVSGWPPIPCEPDGRPRLDTDCAEPIGGIAGACPDDIIGRSVQLPRSCQFLRFVDVTSFPRSQTSSSTLALRERASRTTGVWFGLGGLDAGVEVSLVSVMISSCAGSEE